MTDKQLEYIIEIAKQGNISEAAKKLYISQPSLSNLLYHVEEQYGVRLFNRSAQGMVPTYAGKVFLSSAEKILGNIHELENTLSKIKDEEIGNLRIGVSSQKSAVICSYILPELKKQLPKFNIEIREESMSDLETLINNATIDVAFLYNNDKLKDLNYVPVLEERHVLVAPENFDCIGNIENNNQEIISDYNILNGKPFVLMKKGKRLRDFADMLIAKKHFEPNIILETYSWQTCLTMVEKNNCFTFLSISKVDIPDLIKINENAKYKIIELDEPYKKNLCLFYQENISNSKVINILKDICSSFTSGLFNKKDPFI